MPEREMCWIAALSVMLWSCTPKVQCECNFEQAAPSQPAASVTTSSATASAGAPPRRDMDFCTKLAPPPAEYRVEGARAGAMEVSRKIDLDGDGFNDAWVTAPEFCDYLGNCIYAVYVQNVHQVPEKCGWYVGLTWGSEFSVELFEQHHLRNFQAFNTLGRYGGGSAIVRYRFNRQEYVGFQQQLCIPNEAGLDQCGEEAPLGNIPLPAERWDQPYP